MRTFQTTSEKRLNRESFPFRLYQKAKKFGVWNPEEIDFSQDIKDWETLHELEQKHTLRSIAQFIAGEEAVTLDLLPLIQAVAKDGRLEEEMYLTTFLFEEAKHMDFFERFLREVVKTNVDLSYYHTESHRKIFYEELPQALERLYTDQSPEALAVASTTYNMFAEGVLAETGYNAFYAGLGKIGKLPGLLKGIGLLKKDESRHIAYGTYLLQRLIAENGDRIWEVIMKRMNELMPYAIKIMTETNSKKVQGADAQAKSLEIPFGLDPKEFTEFAMQQINVRLEILGRARGKSLHEVNNVEEQELGVLV